MLSDAGDWRDGEVVVLSAILEHVTPGLAGRSWSSGDSGAGGKSWSGRHRDITQIFPSTPGRKIF